MNSMPTEPNRGCSRYASYCAEEKQMKAIVLSDDELKLLEKRFGREVRHMGSWNSDGTFGHSSVPVVAVQKAAEALENPDLTMALSRLMQTAERTKPFIRSEEHTSELQ